MKRPSVFETGKHITRVNEVQKLKDKKKLSRMSSSKWLMNDVGGEFAVILKVFFLDFSRSGCLSVKLQTWILLKIFW